MTTYNEVAGTRVDRIAGVTDALFAIALTLTVLEVRLPARGYIMTEHDLGAAVLHLAPRALAYLLSFMTLGIFWIGDQTFLNSLHRSDRYLTWLHFAYLATIAILPVSTGVLADYIAYRTAVLLYWLNLLGIGLVSLATISYARRAGLMNGRAGADAAAGVERRLQAGQVLYALGAALCLIQTYWSITFIVLVQTYFAFGQRLPWPRRTTKISPRSAATNITEERDEPAR